MTEPANKADVASILELHNLQVPAREIARRMNLSQKTVRNWIAREAPGTLPKVKAPTSAEQRERIITLAKEKVPDGWIAEDIGYSEKVVGQRRRDAGIPVDEEWKLIRLQIQHDPTLFALHLEFAPPRLRRG